MNQRQQTRKYADSGGQHAMSRYALFGMQCSNGR